MADPLPFVRLDNPAYGVVETLSPLVRRLIAPNPGPFTYTGTGTYIIGAGHVAVIDPGPLNDAHVTALTAALAGEVVDAILITHTHLDHSPAAAPLKAATGARTFGHGPHGGAREDGAPVEEGGDMAFRPDVTLAHGDRITGPGWTFEAVHTPGHTSNHLCFALIEEAALFTGDHVMGWSTTVISPPDGDMAAYFASLDHLLTRDDRRYYPTHGAPVDDPKPLVRGLIAHRRAREAQILEVLRSGPATVPAMVAIIYAAIDPRLHPAAARSLQAHLDRLISEGAIARLDPATRLYGLT